MKYKVQNIKDIVPGIDVPVKDGFFDKAMSTFKKKVQDNNLMLTLKEREHYIKPTVKRRRAKAMARKRWLKYLEECELKKSNF